MATTIDSVNIPPQFSADGGTTWLTLVCTKNWRLGGDTPITIEETYCGPQTGYGTPGYRDNSASATADIVPGSSAVSLEQAQTWWLNKTALKFRAQYPNAGTPGSDFYVAGDTVLHAFEVIFGESGTPVGFDISWSLANLDIVP